MLFIKDVCNDRCGISPINFILLKTEQERKEPDWISQELLISVDTLWFNENRFSNWFFVLKNKVILY